jgi:immunoglobulin-binding protein 1
MASDKLNPELKKSENDSTQPNTSTNSTKKPFIITKDALTAKVFGAGYPSLPVYSVEEFYDTLADRGMMPQAGCAPRDSIDPVIIGGGVTESQKQDDKAEKERLEDENDEDELRKQREWDEFKDDHKRGEGNRYNRS